MGPASPRHPTPPDPNRAARTQRWRLRYNQRGKAGDVAPAAELLEPVLDVVLAPGDVLFVPRGVYHRTSTAPEAFGAHSLHITFGVETDTDEWTWLALLRYVQDHYNTIVSWAVDF
jgi:hypothetical protein